MEGRGGVEKEEGGAVAASLIDVSKFTKPLSADVQVTLVIRLTDLIQSNPIQPTQAWTVRSTSDCNGLAFDDCTAIYSL